jgi:Protein of unknown function (DUF2924)
MNDAPSEPASAAPQSSAGHCGPQTQAGLDLPLMIDGLAALTSEQLREEWRRLYRSQPPRLSRDLLIRTIAYRMQEHVYGGPSKATMRRLLSSTKGLEKNGSLSQANRSVRRGMRLVREWHGKLHTVTVTQDAFEYAGQRYLSLTSIAHAITGTHWSGPRFFGLRQRPSNSNGPTDDEACHD